MNHTRRTHYIYQGRDVSTIYDTEELRAAIRDCIERNFQLRQALIAALDGKTLEVKETITP